MHDLQTIVHMNSPEELAKRAARLARSPAQQARHAGQMHGAPGLRNLGPWPVDEAAPGQSRAARHLEAMQAASVSMAGLEGLVNIYAKLPQRVAFRKALAGLLRELGEA
jgi:hypothetical protein